MRSLDQKHKTIIFLGIFIPLMIGCAVSSLGLETSSLSLCVTIADVANIIQLGSSLWSSVSGQGRSYDDCMASVRENTAIYNLVGSVCKKIGKLNEARLEVLIDDLTEEFEWREQEDLTLCVNDKELRYANRVPCFYFKKECHICNVVPLTLKPEKCVCDGYGKF